MSRFFNICFPDFSIFFSKFLPKDVKSYVLAYKKTLKNGFQALEDPLKIHMGQRGLQKFSFQPSKMKISNQATKRVQSSILSLTNIRNHIPNYLIIDSN